jgi:hypothetical protein
MGSSSSISNQISMPEEMGSEFSENNRQIIQSGGGKSIHVGGSGPGNLSTISQALNTSNNGDFIFIHQGEYEELTSINRSVSLIGIGRPLLNGSGYPGGYIMEVVSDNVTISGLELRGGSTAIHLNASGFNISGNFFKDNLMDINWSYERNGLDNDVHIHSSSVINNTFDRPPSVDGLSSCMFSVDLDFNENGVNATVDDLEIKDNIFHMNITSDTGLDLGNWIHINNLQNGSLVLSRIVICNNTFHAGECGIVASSLFEDINDLDISSDDVVIARNEFFYQSKISINASIPSLISTEGETSLENGELVIRDNVLKTGIQNRVTAGIKVQTGMTNSLSGNSSYSSGLVRVISNHVTNRKTTGGMPTGIIVISDKSGSRINDNSSFDLRGIEVIGNNISGVGTGICIDLDGILSFLEGSSSSDYGPIDISENDIFTMKGLDISSFSMISCNLKNDTSSDLGVVEISNNLIRSEETCILFDGFDSIACGLSGESSFKWLGMDIVSNDMEGDDYWIYNPMGLKNIGEGLFDNASCEIGEFRICENLINDSEQGYGSFFLNDMGQDMHGNSRFTFSGLNFSGNTVSYSTLRAGDGYNLARYLYDNSTVSIGFMKAVGNVINCLEMDALEVNSGSVGYSLYDNSTVDFNGIMVQENEISCLGTGILMKGPYGIGRELYHRSSVSYGGTSISNNSVNSQTGISSSSGSTGRSMHGETRCTTQGDTIANNILTTSDKGILVREWTMNGYVLSGTSTAEIGGLWIHGNRINSTGVSLTIDGLNKLGSELSGSSLAVVTCPIIERNLLNGGSGVIVRPSEICSDLMDRSSSEVEGIRILENEIVSVGFGIHIVDMEDIIFNIQDEATASFKMVEVCENSIVSENFGIYISSMDRICVDLRDSTLTRLGKVAITGNTVTSYYTSISINSKRVLSSLSHTSTSRWDGIDISDNTLNTYSSGIVIELANLVERTFSWSRIEIGEFSFDGNVISANWGLYLLIGEMNLYNSSFLSMGTISVNGTVIDSDFLGINISRTIRTRDSSKLEWNSISLVNCRIEGESGEDGIVLKDRIYHGSTAEMIAENDVISLNSLEKRWRCLDINTTIPVHVYLNNFNDFVDPGISRSNNTIFHSPGNISYIYLQTNLKSPLGNHWEGHTSPDANGDGIVDIPFYLESGVDPYPLKFNWSELYPPIDDKSPPLLSFITENGTIFLGRNVKIEWEAPDQGVGLKECLLKIDDNPLLNNGRATFIDLEDLEEGKHEIAVTAVDFIGNNIMKSIHFWIDTDKPTAALVDPESGSILGSGDLPLTLAWNSFDEGTWIANIAVSLDNETVMETSNSTDSIIWDRDIEDGWHTLRLEVSDGAGRIRTIISEFAIDTEAPVVQFMDGGMEIIINRSNTILEWNVYDMVSGLKDQFFRIDGGTWSGIGKVENRSLFGLDQGSHLAELRVRDLLGNERIFTVEITVDTVGPSIEIGGITDGFHTNRIYHYLSLELNGTGSDLASIRIMFDGNPLLPSKEAYSLGPLNEGRHHLHIRLEDRAGNIKEKNLEFFVDTLAPDVIEFGPEGSNADTDSRIYLMLNEEISHAEVNLESPFIGGTIEIEDNMIEFNPLGDLEVGTEYTLGFRFQDLAGNSDDFILHFRTAMVESGWGSLRGVVRDGNGDPVGGITVSSDHSFETITDDNGMFILILPEGENRIEIEGEGFKKLAFTVSIGSGEITEIREYRLEETSGGDGDQFLWPLIVILLILIALVIGIIFFLVRKDDEEEFEGNDIFVMEEDDYFDDIDLE